MDLKKFFFICVMTKNKSNLKDKDKSFLNEIKKDLLKLSKYENCKKMDFYFLCAKIAQKYKI